MEPNPEKPTGNKALAGTLLRRYERLKGERAVMESQWRSVARFFAPRKSSFDTQNAAPNISAEAELYDTTGVDSLRTMAAGLLSGTTPPSEPWFAFEPPQGLSDSDDTKLWLQACTQRAQEALANSNYYTERHENLLNKCGFGTTVMLVEMRGNRLRFESLRVGSFCIDEDPFGDVRSIYRERTFTAQQAVEMFGEENLSADILKAFRQEQDGQAKREFEFIHAICPREEKDVPPNANRNAAIFMPFASIWLDCAAKMIVKESGFPSFPAVASRYEKWDRPGVPSAWGYSPALSALPDASQASHLAKQFDVAVERSIQPPMVVGCQLEGQLRMGANGITYVAPSTSVDQYPRELYKPGDITPGLKWLESKQEAIKTKFHVGLFQMFEGIERQMTAREVMERSGERLMLITPAFSRDQMEECTPLLQTVFELMAEAGIFPPPPPDAVVLLDGGRAAVPSPVVNLTSRMALAIKELRGVAGDKMVEWMGVVGQVKPQVWDNVDIDALTRSKALGLGMDASMLVPVDQRDQAREAQAMAQAKQQQMLMATEAAKAAGGGQGIAALMETQKQ